MTENGRQNIFRDKPTTNKVSLMFSVVKRLTLMEKLCLWIASTNKKDTVYAFSI